MRRAWGAEPISTISWRRCWTAGWCVPASAVPQASKIASLARLRARAGMASKARVGTQAASVAVIIYRLQPVCGRCPTLEALAYRHDSRLSVLPQGLSPVQAQRNGRGLQEFALRGRMGRQKARCRHQHEMPLWCSAEFAVLL